jgi:hypothetical protein
VQVPFVIAGSMASGYRSAVAVVIAGGFTVTFVEDDIVIAGWVAACGDSCSCRCRRRLASFADAADAREATFSTAATVLGARDHRKVPDRAPYRAGRCRDRLHERAVVHWRLLYAEDTARHAHPS